MTQRDVVALVAVALAPAVLALVGHALQLDEQVLAALVWVGWIGCVAAVTRVGGRSR